MPSAASTLTLIRAELPFTPSVPPAVLSGVLDLWLNVTFALPPPSFAVSAIPPLPNPASMYPEVDMLSDMPDTAPVAPLVPLAPLAPLSPPAPLVPLAPLVPFMPLEPLAPLSPLAPSPTSITAADHVTVVSVAVPSALNVPVLTYRSDPATGAGIVADQPLGAVRVSLAKLYEPSSAVGVANAVALRL